MDKSSNTNTSITEFFPLHAFQVLPRHVLIIFLVFIIPSEAQFYVSFLCDFVPKHFVSLLLH